MNVDEMLEKTNVDTVSYTRFCSEYAKNSERPICLVEGYDATYYRVRVKSVCEVVDTAVINCGGKKEVVNTRKLISQHEYYDAGKILAFVDRDFDDLMNDASIYETPCYSIENFYTSEEAFKSILKDEFRINEYEEEDDFNKCTELYLHAQQKFHEAMLELNAWIYCQRKKSKTESTNRLHLNDKHNKIMNQFIRITLADVEKLYNIESITFFFPDAYVVSEEEKNSMIAQLRDLNYQQVFRGKYEIDFLGRFIAKLVYALNSKTEFKKHFRKKRNISFKVTDGDLLSQFSQHADIPLCLIKYIKSIWNGDIIPASIQHA